MCGGNPLGGLRVRRPGRSIPACAGEPASPAVVSSGWWVYPRVCGGTRGRCATDRAAYGLSPRVRGEPSASDPSPPTIDGLSPRVRGEPNTPTGGPSPAWVYPRVCGGTGSTKTVGLPRRGLSPRVRGNRRGCASRVHLVGSIPACAGEPSPTVPPPATSRVYPRVCGGTNSWQPRVATGLGLSPRVRGNPATPRPGLWRTGSIPACAGEPHRVAPAASTDAVYPRVCGGTALTRTVAVHSGGLSPRVRGNHFAAPVNPDTAGSIPACAGEPTGGLLSSPSSAVYPRVCGGTRYESVATSRTCGLSPRVRGNLDRVPVDEPAAGSIPACAGEPLGESCQIRVVRSRLRGFVRWLRWHPSHVGISRWWCSAGNAPGARRQLPRCPLGERRASECTVPQGHRGLSRS